MRLLYGKETSISEILETVKSYPMFGKKQLVIVKDAQYLHKDMELLIPYLENYLSQTILVICYGNKRTDTRSKLFKSIKKKSKLIEFETLYESDVYKWIARS